MKLPITCTILLLNSLLFSKTYSQQKNSAGFDIQAESPVNNVTVVNQGAKKITQTKFTFAPGIMYERKLSPLSSLQIELKYRREFNNIAVLVTLGTNFNSTLNFTTKESFLSLPVLYRLNTKWLTLSLGPALDYLIKGEQEKNASAYPAVLGDDFYPKKWSFGFISRLSKTIKLEKRVKLEPALFYNPVLSFKRSYYGFSVAAKYEF